MNILLALFLLFCVCDSSRIKRQLDGGFWWDNTAQTDPPPPPPEEEKKEVNSPVVESKVSGTNPETPALPSYQPCSGKNRVCVPYTLCENGKIVTDGGGLLTTRTGNVGKHSECPLYLEVCCEEPYAEGTEPKEEFIPPPSCGQRNTQGVGAGIQGLADNLAQFGEFPWMTAILKRERFIGSEFKLYLCGGSLIEPNVVLTAAHCIYTQKAENTIVRAGEWDTQETYEPIKHQELDASQIIIHPNFNPQSLANDFALVVLKTPFKLEATISPICLPNQQDSFEGQVCYATGWGKEEFGERGTYQNILKSVDLEMVGHHNCQSKLKTTRLGQYFQLHDSFVCAGGQPGKDTCRGDGGSPLVCSKRDHSGNEAYYQTGIVAWGIGCGENGVPGVYADVRKAVDWINGQRNFF